MKKDVRSSAEKEALQWAIEYFCKHADEMTPEGSRRWSMQDAVNGLLRLYDSPHSDQFAAANETIIGDVLSAWHSHPGASQYMREFAATLMERGDQLPPPLLEFIVAFLRNPDKPKWPTRYVKIIRKARGDSAVSDIDQVRRLQAHKPGQSSTDRTSRNISIWAAVEHIVKTWKIPATRNEATESACATSIVRKALEMGAGVKLKEAAVVRVWRNMRPAGEEALALDPSVLDMIIGSSEKIPTD